MNRDNPVCMYIYIYLSTHTHPHIYTKEYYSVIKRRKSCHLWQHGGHYLSEIKLDRQFSLSVMSNTLQPHRLHHTRTPCPSPTDRACSNSSPLSWWYHPTISSSIGLFSSCLQSFPTSGFFPVSQFTSGGQKYWSFRFRINFQWIFRTDFL